MIGRETTFRRTTTIKLSANGESLFPNQTTHNKILKKGEAINQKQKLKPKIQRQWEFMSEDILEGKTISRGERRRESPFLKISYFATTPEEKAKTLNTLRNWTNRSDIHSNPYCPISLCWNSLNGEENDRTKNNMTYK